MRTLVVEDAGSIRRLLETLLSERGHEVITAETGEDALDAHERAPFELVLVDVVLPAMGGVELVRRIRRLPGGDLPVIVAFTGRPDDTALDDLLDAGVDDYLTKPLVPEELRRRLVIAEAHVRRARRRATQAELRQADRVATVAQLAVGVAHEVNNPLAAVLSNLQVLAQELRRVYGDDAERLEAAKELVAEAIEGSERVRSIISDLRTFARDSGGVHRSVSLAGVVETAVGLARNDLRHRARLEVLISPAPEVVADERLLVQAFLNLLISFSLVLPEGDAASRSVRVEVGTTEDGRAFVLVAGAGPRIEPHELGRALDPYSPTGAGLHLSVCQNVIASMGGHIEVPPDISGLRAFRVTMPAAQEKVETIPVPPTVASDGPAEGLRVLVIDDEALVARSLRRALRGHDVTIAGGGQRAIEIFAGGQTFDVVLCDLMMPDLSGMELFDRVQKEHPTMARRFVFMTGGAFTARARAFLERVPNHRIDKPFEVALVREIVREVGARP